jgi:hypothetical protein
MLMGEFRCGKCGTVVLAHARYCPTCERDFGKTVNATSEEIKRLRDKRRSQLVRTFWYYALRCVLVLILVSIAIFILAIAAKFVAFPTIRYLASGTYLAIAISSVLTLLLLGLALVWSAGSLEHRWGWGRRFYFRLLAIYAGASIVFGFCLYLLAGLPLYFCCLSALTCWSISSFITDARFMVSVVLESRKGG